MQLSHGWRICIGFVRPRYPTPECLEVQFWDIGTDRSKPCAAHTHPPNTQNPLKQIKQNTQNKKDCIYTNRIYTASMLSIYPYVGIIQIRLRVRAIQPTLSLLCASSPFLYSFYSSTLFRFLQGGCPIFLYFFAEILCRPAKAGQADGSFFWRIGIRTRSSNQPSWVVMVAVPPYLAAVFWMLLTPKPW